MALSTFWSVTSVSLLCITFSSAAWADGPCSPPAVGCNPGYECTAVALPCSTSACEPNAPDCKSTSDCVDGGTAYTCTPRVNCTVDSECAPAMVCHESTSSQCSGGTAKACPPNSDCIPEPPTPPSCTTSTVKACTYRSSLPCQLDVDCGEGFQCVSSVMCTGVAGTGTATAGTAVSTPTSSGPVVTAPNPTTTPTTAPISAKRVYDAGAIPMGSDAGCTAGPKYCRVVEKTCSSANECPSGWTCIVPPCAPPLDGGTVYCPGSCMPPGGRRIADDVSEVTTGGAPGGLAMPMPSDPNTSPPNADGGVGKGSEGTLGGRGDASPDADSGSLSTTNSTASMEGGGCSLGHGAGRTEGALPWLGLLGALWALRRRRVSN